MANTITGSRRHCTDTFTWSHEWWPYHCSRTEDEHLLCTPKSWLV